MKKIISAHTKTENELMTKSENIFKDFKYFQKPFVNNIGDIIRKFKSKNNDVSILTNIFREIIKNDVKKTGYKTLFRILNI